jgi:hypothetical protein
MNITEKILSTDFGDKWLEEPIPVMKVLNVLKVSLGQRVAYFHRLLTKAPMI